MVILKNYKVVLFFVDICNNTLERGEKEWGKTKADYIVRL